MKKIFYLMISALILCTSCKDDEKDFQTFGVKIQLAYPQGSPFKPTEGIEVTLTDIKGSALKEKTDKTGTASFNVPSGVYKAFSGIPSRAARARNSAKKSKRESTVPVRTEGSRGWRRCICSRRMCHSRRW